MTEQKFEDQDELRNGNLTLTELNQLCYDFRLGRLLNPSDKLNSGKTNLTRRIGTSRGSFVIKQFQNPITEDRLNYIQNIIYALNQSGINVPIPILDRFRRCFSTLGKITIQITPFIEALPFNFKKEEVFHSGLTLRKFHDVLSNQEDGPPSSYSTYPSIKYLIRRQQRILEHNTSHLTEQQEKIINQYDQIIKALRFSNIGILPKTTVHCDWNFWNQLYSRDGKVCCILDLDGVQRRERIHDIAYAIYFIYKIIPLELREEYTMSFLGGYGQLEAKEEELLGLAIARICLYFIEEDPSNSLLIDFFLSNKISF